MYKFKLFVCCLIFNLSYSNFLSEFDKITLNMWADLDLMLAINLNNHKKRFLPKIFDKSHDIYTLIKKNTKRNLSAGVASYLKTRIDLIRNSFDLVFSEPLDNSTYQKINKIFYKLDLLLSKQDYY